MTSGNYDHGQSHHRAANPSNLHSCTVVVLNRRAFSLYKLHVSRSQQCGIALYQLRILSVGIELDHSFMFMSTKHLVDCWQYWNASLISDPGISLRCRTSSDLGCVKARWTHFDSLSKREKALHCIWSGLAWVE